MSEHEDSLTQSKLHLVETSIGSLAEVPTEAAEGTPSSKGRSGAGARARAPEMLERYTVLRELGAGGMGKVYLAYDDRLDRRVAIKRVHGYASPRAKRRLEREAQAMAQLAHANVVTVFEVGKLDEELFIVMEYVQGVNLRQWLRRGERSREQILSTFLRAGEGLAAAHEAGIVHRDFKPDNVLVGDDGRVLVADFGLAFGERGLDSSRGGAADGAGEPVLTPAQGSLHTRLTRTGAAVGTPAYMAAELLRGGSGDARSDQFAFCVALWEALFGARPFVGESIAHMQAAVMLERVTEPSEHEVPAWLREVLLRGLRAAPKLRWPDMRALLAALADDPIARRRRRWRLGLSVGVSLALIAGLSSIALEQRKQNLRQRYWNELTEELLELERTRSLAQARDDARRAKNATRMSAVRSFRRDPAVQLREDPTAAALLLRELEGEAPAEQRWTSLANLTLGDSISHAILRGHSDTVRALALRSDGARLYSAAADGELWRWDTRTGGGERFARHAGPVHALALSSDESLLASASEDGQIRVWRTESLERGPLLELAHAQGVTALAFDPRGQRLLSSSRDGTARIDRVDGVGGGASVTLRGHAGAVLTATFDRRGERVLSASADGSARLWSAEDGRELERLSGHREAVYFAHFTNEGAVVTGGDDGEVRVWRPPAPGEDRGYEGERLVAHGGPVTALAVHGRQVASAASDRSVRVSSLDAPAGGVELRGHDADVWSLAFTPDGQQLATASRDGTARLWRSDGGGVPRVLRGHEAALLRLALDGSGRWLATGGWDAEIRVWDLQRPRLARQLPGHRRAVLSLAYDPGSEELISGSADGELGVWTRAGTGRARLGAGCSLSVVSASGRGAIAGGCADGSVLVWTGPERAQTLLGRHAGGVHALAFSPDGHQLLSAASDGSVRLWQPGQASEQAVHALEIPGGPVLRVGFSDDGAWLYTAGGDGVVRRWHAGSGELERSYAGHAGAVRDFVLSGDQRLLASAGDDHEARVWRVAAPERVQVLRGHEQRLLSVAFDREARRLLSASADGTARLWSTEEGAELQVLRGHEGAIWGAQFIDGLRVVTHGEDGSVRVWSLDAPAQPLVLSAHGDSVVSLSQGPGWLASGSVDGQLVVWELAQLEPDRARLEQALFAASTACLSPAQRQRELGESALEAGAAARACAARYGR